jgi:hypothetical protein
MQAWIDLLLLANHSEQTIFVRGNEVLIGIGQLAIAQANLASRWQWSKGKVIRFLEFLEQNKMIELQKSSVINLISITNYSKYQDNGTTDRTTDDTTDRTTDGLQTEQQTGHKQEYKNDKNDKNEEEWKEENNLLSQRAREAEKFAPLNANDVAFADFYRRTFNTDFIWQENTSQSVQRIIDSIENTIRANGDIPDPATMPQYLTDFLNAVYRLNDKWLNERFNPQLIAKQYNQLYNRISNGAKSKQQAELEAYAKAAGVSPEFLAEVTAGLGGSL